MTVTGTMSGAVTGRGPMSTEAEGQTIEAVPTTTVGITRGRGTGIAGTVMQEETKGE